MDYYIKVTPQKMSCVDCADLFGYDRKRLSENIRLVGGREYPAFNVICGHDGNERRVGMGEETCPQDCPRKGKMLVWEP